MGIAMSPRQKIMMERTIAKIGRSIKNFEMFIAVAPLSLSRRGDGREALIRRFHLGGLRSYGRTWEEDQLKTAYNDAVFASQTGLNDAQSIRHAAEDDVLTLRCVPRSNDINVLPVL